MAQDWGTPYPVADGPQAGLGHGDHGARLNDGVELVSCVIESSDHDLAALGVQQREACSKACHLFRSSGA